MTIKELRNQLSYTQTEFAKRYNIPFRTIQNWESGDRTPPQYVIDLLENKITRDLINHKTVSIPSFTPNKPSLPDSSNYLENYTWLKEIQKRIGEDIVFALDEALMCHQLFLGRNKEYIVWIYGPDSAKKFNGIAILGNTICQNDIEEKYGIKYTSFNRTIIDALENESLLDMQGITEALSNYYYSHNKSLQSIYIPPEYQNKYNLLVRDALDYYNN